MSNLSGAAQRREDVAAEAHGRVDEPLIERTASSAGLERRTAFPQGARLLLGAAHDPKPCPAANGSPLHALPRTAPLRAGGGATRLAVVGAASPATTAHAAPFAQSLGHMLRALWLPAALYIMLNVGDVVSTYLGLHHGLNEGNPLMGLLLSHDGFVALIAYKVLITMVVLAGLWLLGAWSDRAARVALLICNTLVALVVILNLAQYAVFVR